jgi:methylated-DNA-[protein]-cysteine S-methyltransferase
MESKTYYTTMHSPIDDLLLVSDGQALTALTMEPARHGGRVEAAWKRDPGPFREVVRQLLAYFEGELREFDLPLSLPGTEFQRTVWAGLRDLRFGEQVSYGELAGRLGRPGSGRAVGTANGRNPIGIIVPCHRVIAAGGKLGGYGGGLGRKQWLLEHEATVAAQARSRGA